VRVGGGGCQLTPTTSSPAAMRAANRVGASEPSKEGDTRTRDAREPVTRIATDDMLPCAHAARGHANAVKVWAMGMASMLAGLRRSIPAPKPPRAHSIARNAQPKLPRQNAKARVSRWSSRRISARRCHATT